MRLRPDFRTSSVLLDENCSIFTQRTGWRTFVFRLETASKRSREIDLVNIVFGSMISGEFALSGETAQHMTLR